METASPAARPPERPWLALVGVATATITVAAALALFVHPVGAAITLGHGTAVSRLGWATPTPTLGAMVTMVGPLGVTFPCWAARHFGRPSPRAPADPR